MTYPVILNGDHAEFEREHANTPPKERPDWPLPSFDARDWAEAFVKKNPNSGLDENTMLGWFANALMRGHDEAMSRSLTPLLEEVAVKQREAADIIYCIRSTSWGGSEEIVEMIRRRIKGRERLGAAGGGKE